MHLKCEFRLRIVTRIHPGLMSALIVRGIMIAAQTTFEVRARGAYSRFRTVEDRSTGCTWKTLSGGGGRGGNRDNALFSGALAPT